MAVAFAHGSSAAQVCLDAGPLIAELSSILAVGPRAQVRD